MPFAIWVTGLPGSGKSTIAKEVAARLKDTQHLRLDEMRKKYVAKPKFTDEEREFVYTMFVEDGLGHISRGRNVIYDATANRLAWRKLARGKIKDFIEVYVKCPVEVCMEREAARKEGLVLADLYKKSLERKKTGKEFPGLGQVVGVDIPYEEEPNAEIVIKSDKMEPAEAATIIIEEVKRRGLI
jgi:adenylylsulfate kinase-like enzyme